MEVIEAGVATSDPDFIIYLLDPEQEYNCYFVVGNPKLGRTERIGVVKKMLLAHSAVLRAELQESKIAEKNDVKLIDVFPHTFKNLLRFVYGYDNIEGLSFEEADNLLYVAEKYMLPKLKNRLATRLMSMLDYSNICSLMNNLACYAHLELDSAITEILQTETDLVLASPQFLDLSPHGFLKILEQETLAVPEIELWRSAITWAKNRAGTKRRVNALRNELNDHLQLIRICSLDNKDILEEVLPTGVLTYDELKLVGKSHKTGKVQPGLTTICNVIEERNRPRSELLHYSFHPQCQCPYGSPSESTITLKTKDAIVELWSVQLYTSSAHQCNCTVSIQTGSEPPIVARFQGQVDTASEWIIPIQVNHKHVRLSPNSSYSIQFIFGCSYNHYGGHYRNNQCSFSGSDFSVDLSSRGNGYYLSHINKINYRTVGNRVKSVQA